ncbi:MAG: transglutaminaseTgpA domain-containing protein [Streptosporangiaceae bacterium]
MTGRITLTLMAAIATLLGSISLYPLFNDPSWIRPGVGSVLVVTLAGLVVRRFRLPPPVNLIGALVGLHLYLNAIFAGDQALLRIIPTPSSTSTLVDLLHSGWETAGVYAAPLPMDDGVRLMAALGIGVVAAIVDLLAVRLRRVAPAGLPLLAMYSVPAAVRVESVSWMAFAAGALGYLALLVADSREQMTGWGRPVFTRRWTEEDPGERPSSRPLSSLGRRVGFASIAVAVAIPALVPGISSAGLFGLGGGRGGSGSTTITTADPLVDLRRRLVQLGDREVLTYRTSSRNPDYLRQWSLDKFDDSHWTYSALDAKKAPEVGDGALPTAPGAGGSAVETVTTEVQVSKQLRGMKFLAMPYAPTAVRVDGEWRVDPATLMVFSPRGTADGRKYTVRSSRVLPTADQLLTATRPTEDFFTKVPASVPSVIRTEAVKRTRNAATPYEKAVKLQKWFTSGAFTYSLEPPAPTRVSALVDFLNDKRGYCEQFAATMALMARTLDIPARVVVGYTPGQSLGDGRYIVKQKDSHAWPELYFAGAGWLRFEPTPSGVGGQASASAPGYSIPQPKQAAEPAKPSASPSATPSTSPTDKADPKNRPEAEEAAGTAAKDETSIPVGWISLTLLVLLLLASPWAAHLITQRRRWSTAADPAAASRAAWAQLRTDAVDHGLPWRTSETPRALARRLTRELHLDPGTSAPLARIARAEELSRYAGPAQQATLETTTLRTDGRTVRAAFAASVTRPARLRATVLPPSALQSFRAALTRSLDRLEDLRSR